MQEPVLLPVEEGQQKRTAVIRSLILTSESKHETDAVGVRAGIKLATRGLGVARYRGWHRAKLNKKTNQTNCAT